jgi:hypothetical protein
LLLIAAHPARAASDAWWRLDLAAGTVIAGVGGQPQQDADWSVTGPAEAWERVLRRETNLGVAFRRGLLRYRDSDAVGPGSPAADIRIAMMADLLGISRWQPGMPAGPPQNGATPLRVGDPSPQHVVDVGD